MAYKDSALYYDLFESESDIQYYKELALKSENALEIGVGTARIAIELAKAGVEVWGIDNSPQMLKEAQKKLEKEPVEVQQRIKLVKADMRNFNLSKTFAFVYVPSSTMQHCTTTEEQISCLKAINSHLAKNGLLAFNLILPSTTYNNNLRFIGRATKGDTTIMRFISYQPNSQEQTLEVLLLFEVYEKGTMTKRFFDASTISMIGKREIQLLLEKAGFKIENIYGDYSKSKKIVDHVVIEARKV